MLWVAALIGEEIFDSLQRQMMDDPELQPMVQRLMRIHVTEEARHIQFARDGSRKHVGDMPRLNRMWVANLNGVGGYFFRFLFTNPAQYRRVGLPGARPAGSPARSPHRHDVQIPGFAPLAAFLDEVGLMGPIARRMWRRTHFLPADDAAPPSPSPPTRPDPTTCTTGPPSCGSPTTTTPSGSGSPATSIRSTASTTGAERFSERFPTTCSSGPRR